MGNMTVNLAAVKSGYVVQSNPTGVYRTTGSGTYPCYKKSAASIAKLLFFGFEHLSDSLKNRRLYNIRLRVQSYNSFHAYACSGDFDPNTLCWDNAPVEIDAGDNYRLIDKYAVSGLADRWLYTNETAPYQYEAVEMFLRNYTCYLDCTVQNDAKVILSGGGSPYLEVTLDDSAVVLSKITPRSVPASGYVNPRNATNFSWAFERDSTETYYCAGSFTQSSAALKWQVSGSGTWNTVSASGSTQNLSVPANTFPIGSTIEWYLTGTDTAGTTSETDHFTFSTAAGTALATPTSPINSVEDGSQTIRLAWDLSSTDGQTPIYVDLQFKAPSDGSWSVIWNKHSAASYCNVSTGTFDAGEVLWRVRAYNVDDVAGPWSSINGNPASFICVAAPDAPAGLQATEVPWSTISWQAEGQEAYEIEIDGATVLKKFSPTEYSWHLIEPLEDGAHTIRVRIQGIYGLWSSWASVTIDIINIPPNTLTLDGRFNVDAELQVAISSEHTNPYLQWYRDGVRIAQTHGPLEFTDRTVLGEHSWYAEMWFNSGYYSRSNTVTGTLKSCKTQIALLDYGSPWIPLELSENSDSVQSFSWSQASSLRHVRGSAYPVLEMGESEDLTGSYDCAFKTVQEARQLEALKGKTVIVKSRGGQVLIGALTKLAKRMKDFYITYSFSVQQIHLEDFVRYEKVD